MALQRGEGDTPHQPSDNPDLGELVRLGRRYAAMLLHTVRAGTVVAVTPETPIMPLTVDVQPTEMTIFYDDAGSELPQPLAIVRACPVALMVVGGFGIRVRPRIGDSGLLLVNERSIESWYKGGGVPLPPPFDHTHNLSDSFFLPIPRPAPAPVLTADGVMSIGTETGAPVGAELGEIIIDGTTGQVTVRSAVSVGLEAPAVQLMSGAPLGSFLTALHTAITAWVPAPNDGGAALKTLLAAFIAMQPPGP